MSNTSEIETKPKTDVEALSNKSVFSIDQQIKILKDEFASLENEYNNHLISYEKVEVELVHYSSFKQLIDMKKSILNSLEALKLKIDCNYDYHVVILPTYKMKQFMSYLEEQEAKERKEQNNG